MAEENYPPRFARTIVDGLPVISDEVLISPLSKHTGRLVPYSGTRVLKLKDPSAEDGIRTVYGCNDCPEFTGTRGEVRRHRRLAHPDGSPPPETPEGTLFGLVHAPVPGTLLGMSLGDVLELVSHVEEWSEVLETMEKQVHEAREQAAEERRLRKDAERNLTTMRRRLSRLIGDDEK